ncbi:MAG: phenylalanine 4-monooxygenase [Myxococcota bacterium]
MDIDLVQLDKDHPGFRDGAYRRRRNDIARIALAHRLGASPPSIVYTPEEHEVWRIALEKLAPLHARYACEAFTSFWPKLGFSPERVPQFAQVNASLASLSGFRLSPVAGLVTPSAFMSHLAQDTFLATQYMRHHSAPLYTPEPDVIHELVGHAALLAHPAFAATNRRFGLATLAANEATVEALIRVYWYALEFGVVKGRRGLEVVGAGLLSSFGELGRFEKEAELRPFDLTEVARTPFDPTDYQRVLFVAEGAEALLSTLDAWLEEIAR